MRQKVSLVAIAMVAVVVLGMSGDGVSRAQAAVGTQAFLGEFCWQFDGFPDVLRLSISNNGTTFDVHGRQRASGLYSVVVAGGMATDPEQGGLDISLSTGDYADGVAVGAKIHLKLNNGANGNFGLLPDGQDGITVPPITGTVTFLGACPAASSSVGGARGILQR